MKGKEQIIEELRTFQSGLHKYWGMVKSNMQKKRKGVKITNRKFTELSTHQHELLHQYGKLENIIISLSGTSKDNLPFIWLLSTMTLRDYSSLIAYYTASSDLLTILIGKLESLNDYQYREMFNVYDEEELTKEPPNAFISHGGITSARDKLEQYIKELGITPLIVEDQPTEGKAVDVKVEHYIERADCAIILATADDKVGEKLQPRQNVIHEIGLAQAKFPKKIIYLLEEKAEFPSNINPKVWESFTQECMDKAFIAIARELTAFGLLKTVKPAS